MNLFLKRKIFYFVLFVKTKICAVGFIKKLVGDFPVGYCENVVSLAKQKNWKIESFEIKEFERKKPKNIEKNIDKNFSNQYLLKSHYMHCITVPNGRIISSDGNVVTSNNLVVEKDFTSPAKKLSKVFRLLKLPKKRFIDGKVLVIPNYENYYHWMIEVISRFNYIKNLNSIDYFVLPNNTKYQKESIQQLNIPKEKIIYLNVNTHIEAKELIVPLMPCYSGNPCPQTANFVKNLFLKEIKKDKKYEKIYVSRGKPKNGRLVVNEQEVIKFLEKKGFVSVSMDGLSIKEQARIFNSAKIIIAPHGAALTNLIFCEKGTKVIEFMGQNYINACFWAISNAGGLDYSRFLVKSNYKKNLYINLGLNEIISLFNV